VARAPLRGHVAAARACGTCRPPLRAISVRDWPGHLRGCWDRVESWAPFSLPLRPGSPPELPDAGPHDRAGKSRSELKLELIRGRRFQCGIGVRRGLDRRPCPGAARGGSAGITRRLGNGEPGPSCRCRGVRPRYRDGARLRGPRQRRPVGRLRGRGRRRRGDEGAWHGRPGAVDGLQGGAARSAANRDRRGQGRGHGGGQRDGRAGRAEGGDDRGVDVRHDESAGAGRERREDHHRPEVEGGRWAGSAGGDGAVQVPRRGDQGSRRAVEAPHGGRARIDAEQDRRQRRAWWPGWWWWWWWW
jgi:hypothetical protein